MAAMTGIILVLDGVQSPFCGSDVRTGSLPWQAWVVADRNHLGERAHREDSMVRRNPALLPVSTSYTPAGGRQKTSLREPHKKTLNGRLQAPFGGRCRST